MYGDWKPSFTVTVIPRYGLLLTALMKLYRSRQLNNPTMQTVAMRLSDDDIAALAAYFSALKPPD